MTYRRALIPALFLVGVAFACGDGPNDDTASSGEESASSDVSSTSASSEGSSTEEGEVEGETSEGGQNTMPPESCANGTDASSGQGYVVCSADANSAWISFLLSDGPYSYAADAICEELGYSAATAWIAEGGPPCGISCEDPGDPPNFDDSSSCPAQAGSVCGMSPQWLCGF